MSPTQTMSMNSTQTGTRNSPCGCQDQPPAQVCCCNLVCFDRPNYFCGHLLTDADLTLQQKYVVEKNKLYHRTIDGYGVVCGLKLTCDCDCKGNILIHDGFAIDDCGNDLIVCETTRFDVIAALKSKNLLVVDPEEDDCEPRRHRSRCEIRQCFYVTICYEETESAYETPFQSSCTSGPKQCLPTRTHEGVRFDVTEKLPHRTTYIDELEKRIRGCFQINCDSPIGVILQESTRDLLGIFGDSQEELRSDPCELFCRLRAYFLNHLRVKPSEFNCGLHEEVSCLACPGERRYGNERQDGRREWEREYRDEVREAFSKLLYCIQRYQYDCVLGDLVFSCQQPCEAHCLVLGTVEVLNGKLVRVCNTPRKYLWAPANLSQVLMYEVMSAKPSCDRGDKEIREDEDGNNERNEERNSTRACCCPDYPRFEPTEFLREFELDPCGRRYAAEAAVESFREVAKWLHQSFDFTDSMAYAPRLFARLLEQEQKDGEFGEDFLGVRASMSATHAAKLGPLTFGQSMMAKALVKPGAAVQGYRSQEGIRVLPDYLAALSPDRSVGDKLERESGDHARQISELREEIEALKRKVERTSDDNKKGKKSGA